MDHLWTRAIFARLVRHRWIAIGACLALAGVLASFTRFEIDTSLRIWFLEDDPDVATYDAYLERFETDEFVVVALESDSVFETDLLRDVERVSEVLSELPEVRRVNSLATLQVVDSDGSSLRAAPLWETLPEDPEALDALRERVISDTLLHGFVSDDERATVIIAEHGAFEDLRDKALFGETVRSEVAAVVGERGFRAAGNALVDDAMQRYTIRDLVMLAPLTVLMIVLVTFAMFRNLWCTLVPGAIVGLTLASAVGLAGMFGVKLNMITTIVIPLSMAVGIADSVHVIAAYRERLAAGGAEKLKALEDAWIELLSPCLMTTATTALGLASLLSTNLVPVRQFGWMGAATVVFALLYTLVLVPAVFAMVDAPTPKTDAKDDVLRNALDAMARFSWGNHRAVLVGTAGLIVLAIVGVTRVQTGAEFSQYFLESDPVYQDLMYIDEHLGGTSSVDIMFLADDVRTPEVLRAMADIEAELEEAESVQSADSPAELVSILHERWFADPERRTVPDSLAASAQLLSQTEGTSMHARLMVTDYSAGRIRGRFKASEVREMIEMLPRFEGYIEERSAGVADVEVTGVGKLVANLDTYIIQSQVRSFLLAFLTVGLLMALFFRSAHIGVWALVPNAFPILFVIGLMGWTGIELDMGTVMVASIMLGLIVDDTVHYLSRYRREWRRAGQPADGEALWLVAQRTGVGTGRALATTSVILAAAFFLSLSASFRPNVNFGLLCGIATITALLCDLLALPAVIRAWPLRSKGPSAGHESSATS